MDVFVAWRDEEANIVLEERRDTVYLVTESITNSIEDSTPDVI